MSVSYIHRRGKKFWRRGRYLHCVWPNGTKRWYRDNLLHREDGPADIWANGTECYYIDGKSLSKEVFRKAYKESRANCF